MGWDEFDIFFTRFWHISFRGWGRMAWRWVDGTRSVSKQYITSHQLRQFTTVAWSRHFNSNFSHLSVFLQVEQSWANLHWSACLCAILASSSSHTCKMRNITEFLRKQYLWVYSLSSVYTRRNLSLEKHGSVLRIQVHIQHWCWEIVAINCPNHCKNHHDRDIL